MKVSVLDFDFTDIELLHCYNALPNICVVFNFAETVHLRNKSHLKFKAFTLSNSFITP